jgi:peptidyl-prolyl cis-trans isomerase C
VIQNEFITEVGIKRGYDSNPDLNRRVNKYKRELITEYVIENEIKKRVTDDKVSIFYNANKHRFVEAERVRVRHILVDSSDKAEMILKKLKNKKENFQKLAKLYSTDSTAPHGGDLGFFGPGRMVPDFENAAFALKENGELSKVVKTSFGYHIIQLINRKNKRQLQLEEVKPEIEDIVLEDEKVNFLKEFKDSKKVKIYDLGS